MKSVIDMKNFLLLVMSLLVVLTTEAQAQGVYAKIFSGANFLQNTTINGNKSTYQTGYIVSGVLGYSWRYYGLRFESEYAFRRVLGRYSF